MYYYNLLGTREPSSLPVCVGLNLDHGHHITTTVTFPSLPARWHCWPCWIQLGQTVASWLARVEMKGQGYPLIYLWCIVEISSLSRSVGGPGQASLD